MDVRELNEEQLDELKVSYFYSDEYDESIVNGAGLPCLFPCDIPDAVIFEKFAGIYFVPDDFSCTAGQ